jgi:hypothetical protein
LVLFLGNIIVTAVRCLVWSHRRLYRRLGGAYRFRAQLRLGLHLHDGVAAGCRTAALASIRLLKNSSIERRQLHERAALLRRRLDAAGIPHRDIRAI